MAQENQQAQMDIDNIHEELSELRRRELKTLDVAKKALVDEMTKYVY